MAVLAGLDTEQRVAVTAPRGPVCVLAGAGTGKTRTITQRIAHLVRSGHVAPGQVLAVTFTARAAGELRNRLRVLGVSGVQARTFHAAALRQLRYFWPRVVGDEPWRLVEHKLRLVGQAAHDAGRQVDVDALRDLATEIEWAKASLVSPQNYAAAAAAAHRDTPAPVEQVAAIYAGYELVKTEARTLDFDDLLLYVCAALEDHADVATEFRDRYRCFVVDEYQDVTPLQQRVLDAWLGGRDDVTVVGDANQTIYTFAGATPSFLLDFPRRFRDAVVVRLERDYRSTPEVVSVANRVIATARGPRLARLRLAGQLPPGPQPEFAEFDDEPAEAAAVAARIGRLIEDGLAPSEIAVLYRVNAQSEAYEQALTEAGIGYQVHGGERFFTRPEVRQAIRALRTEPPAERPLAEHVRGVLVALGMGAEPPPGGGVVRQRWESLRAIVGLAEELAAVEPGADLPRFVAELDLRALAQHPPPVQGVTLASLHAAKGLEWTAVFLVGLAEGTLPIQHADGHDGAVEEERRLLYVGITRARRFLHLSWSLARTPGGRRHRRRSRFLYGVVPDEHPVALARIKGGQAQVRAERTRPRCRVCGGGLVGPVALKLRRCGSCPADVDDELLARLLRWRAERAKRQGVPTYVVFTDATLSAIAEQRPADQAGLVAIPGIGASKLGRYGADVLALVRGDHPPSS
ncbi:MAG TPA: ATP-dependent DNA helicase UvrD2 [Pseudonocardiaceae bacterium]|nr:ATP-dependent DNA helicase UvrD2 [Pseudonocardiaceae bacterium]